MKNREQGCFDLYTVIAIEKSPQALLVLDI